MWTAMLSPPWEVNVSAALDFHDLGFDIADRDMLSGMSNCRLSSHELANLRSEWSTKINSIGLLGCASDALRLKAVLDRLIREHAPFYVYRIREVVCGAYGGSGR